MQWRAEANRALHRTAGELARRLRRDAGAARVCRSWQAFCTSLTGLAAPAGAALTAELRALVESEDVTAAEVLFALQSAFALFCHCSVAHILGHDPAGVDQQVIGDQVHVSPAHQLFRESWQFTAAELREWSGRMTHWWGSTPEDAHQSTGPIFSQLYQEMFPPKARRLLGEFHTPVRLADQLLEDLPALAQESATVIDPACGCGIFVDAALRRKREAGVRSLNALLAGVSGLEVNPAPLAGAWASYCFRVADLLRANRQPVSIPISLVNTLSPAADETGPWIPCDFVVGNPPWVNWEDLEPAFRQRTAVLMRAYGLIPESAAVGAVKLDLAALALVVAVDRLLKPGGTLAFVMPQSALKARAMTGLRRFRLPDGTPFGPVRAHDLAGLQLFAGAVNRAACLVVRKGKEPAYPVATLKWSLESCKDGKLICRRLAALPLGPDRTAPWLAVPRPLVGFLQPLLAGPCAYTPREGVNTGGGSSFFWGFARGSGNDTTVIFRTDPTAGRIKGPELTGERVEGELLYPLLKGRGVRRWHCQPDERVLLLPHTPASGMHAIPERELAKRYPRWWEVLSRPQVRSHLGARRALLRWGGGVGFAWYSLFEVGPYTFLPYKVGYRGEVATDFAAAVFASVDHPVLGRKLVIPDQTVHYVGVSEECEAHFLAGLFNSVFVRLLYQCFDYKHPSTFFVKCLRIPAFDGGALHREVADLASILSDPAAVSADLGERLDRLAAEVFGIPDRAVALCRKELRK